MLGKYEYSVLLCCLIKSFSYTWSRIVSNNEHRDLRSDYVSNDRLVRATSSPGLFSLACKRLKTMENYELTSPKNVVTIAAYKSLVTVVTIFFEMLELHKALTENFSVLDIYR